MTTTTREATISPIGSTAEGAAQRRYARSAAYREQHDRLAPYRVIADAVILARGAHNLTQRDLGDAIGTTDTAISRIESGRHPVTLKTLAKLGKALDLAFVVGSAKGKLPDGCIVVPDIAIEQEPARRAPTPSYARGMTPTYAFGDSVGARPQSANKSR